MGNNIITILVEDLTVDAQLVPSATVIKILETLPFESTVNTWGDEIYLTIPAQLKKSFTSLRAFSKLREISD